MKIKEITYTCNICGALYADKQIIIFNVPTAKYNMCPKCVEERRYRRNNNLALSVLTKN